MEVNKTLKPLAASNIPRPSGIPTRSVINRKRTIAQVEGSDESLPLNKQLAGAAKSSITSSRASSTRQSRVTGTKHTGTAKAPAGAVPTTRKPATTSHGGDTVRKSAVIRGRATGKSKSTNSLAEVSKKPVAKQGGSGSIEQILNEVHMLSSRMSKLESEKEETHHTALSQQQQRKISDKLKSMEEQLLDVRRQLSESEHCLELAERSKMSLQRAHDDLEVSLASARQEASSLKTTVSQMVADASTINCQLEAVKVTRDQALQESMKKSDRISELEQEIEGLSGSLLECQQQICENESHRRKLHNTIQELKGNIRVFCRVRPSLPSELGATAALDDSTASTDTTSSVCSVGSQTAARGDKGSLHIEFPDKNRDCKRIIIRYSPHKEDSSSKKSCRSQLHEFEYDHVFGPDCSQEDVFREISQLVQSALDGYNVCIFAYGQTGSGKTFTMEGPMDSVEQSQGMIPRAMQQVFSTAQDLRDKGWTYTMEASFIEIYNETLRDLLSTGRKDKLVKHEIRLDSKNQGEVYVTNITPVTISSQEQVTRLLETAAKNRAVAATDCNERSSRSHCLFQLSLRGSNNKTMETSRGSLNLVDLAGSERLSSSGSAMDRLKETQSINKSLSNLGNVIMALANREQHIPYRNSKLTYLLQNSLGGNSKTLMFVNLSPQPTALQETLCSLRFASKVNQCNIGSARKAAKM